MPKYKLIKYGKESLTACPYS